MAFLKALSLALLVASLGSTQVAQSRDHDLSNAKRIKSRSTGPAPLVIPPSQYWDGVDGLWSSIGLRVGTPPQDVRVLVSTASPETIVVLPQGCTTAAMDPVPADCASSRGGLFDNSTSSTWVDQGLFGINGDSVGLEANLGYSQAADYGLETLGLGYVADGPTLGNMTVAGIGSTSPFYLGVFGLSTQPLNYSHIGNYSAPSYFSTLRSKRMIPSLSWSYTAGAKYRLKSGQLSQLIFGGYDTSRFTPNSATFNLADDITRDIVVAIQSITYTGTTQSTLLETPIYAFIDSTDPNIWLPETACQAFETAFGISIDNQTGLYLINDTHYAQLQATNPEVTFTLANSLSGGDTVNIVLPFGAFALPASPPFTPSDTHYFPLRVAETDNQTTLGRSFLQEAYLTVDYERQNFSVSQCTWIDGVASKVASIFPPSDPPDHPRLRVGTIVGVVLAAVSCLLLGASAWFYYRKRKAPSDGSITKYSFVEKTDDSSSHKSFSSFYDNKGFVMQENVLAYQPKPELSTSTEIYQLPERAYREGGYGEEARRLDWQRRAWQASELAAPTAFYELDARPRTPLERRSPSLLSPASIVLGPREVDPTRLTSPLRDRRWI